jgi:hypothetical protein
MKINIRFWCNGDSKKSLLPRPVIDKLNRNIPELNYGLGEVWLPILSNNGKLLRKKMSEILDHCYIKNKTMEVNVCLPEEKNKTVKFIKEELKTLVKDLPTKYSSLRIKMI